MFYGLSLVKLWLDKRITHDRDRTWKRFCESDWTSTKENWTTTGTTVKFDSDNK